MTQLAFSFLLDNPVELNDFVGVNNQQVVTYIQQLLTKQKKAVIYVYGESGTGKTHLLQASYSMAFESSLLSAYIDCKQEIPNTVFEDLHSLEWVCLDNIDNLNPTQQYALFDFYNQAQQNQLNLIISAQCPPSELNMLKDLQTRLSLATVFALEMLSDADKINILEQIMKRKNIQVKHSIYTYLFNYYSRDLTQVLAILERLECYSLEQKNKMSIPLLKTLLRD
jgi:DnaA family protein